MKNVFIVNGSAAYAYMFLSLGFALTREFSNADLVCFTGGEDVSPLLYGDKAHPATHNNPSRDAKEKEYFDAAVDAGIPVVGICRGAQFLNVMSGGRMYQHVGEHCRSHYITDQQTGETVFVSSTHHQMMMPSSDALLVASSQLMGSREWFDGQVARRDISQEDIEVVFYEQTKALCFQPHPEFVGSEYEDMTQYFKGLLSRFLGIE